MAVCHRNNLFSAVLKNVASTAEIKGIQTVPSSVPLENDLAQNEVNL